MLKSVETFHVLPNGSSFMKKTWGYWQLYYHGPLVLTFFPLSYCGWILKSLQVIMKSLETLQTWPNQSSLRKKNVAFTTKLTFQWFYGGCKISPFFYKGIVWCVERIAQQKTFFNDERTWQVYHLCSPVASTFSADCWQVIIHIWANSWLGQLFPCLLEKLAHILFHLCVIFTGL